MLVTDITSGGSIPLLEKTLAFTEARNRVLVTNIANATTPGYRTKQLDPAAFQAALKEAAEQRAAGGSFEMPDTGQLRTDEAGLLAATPSEEPVENLLFQDGTNARIERQMALLAENTMANQVASQLLQNRFDSLSSAIRGRVR